MGRSDKIADDSAGDNMDIALGSLRARKIPMLKVDGLHWILDLNLRPAIVVGYGTDDPEKMSSMHHIVKFHVRKRAIFNVASAMEDYAVKHTRVATPNVVIFDDRIPEKEMIAARDYLEKEYREMIIMVAEAFRARKLKVPPVTPFEPADDEEIAPRIRTITRPKVAKSKVAKTTKPAKRSKKNKRVRFLADEDDEDGPVRQLTPRKKKAEKQAEAIQKALQGKQGATEKEGTDASQNSGREDSVVSEAVKEESPDVTSLAKLMNEGGSMIDLDKDTAISSIEEDMPVPQQRGAPTAEDDDTLFASE